MNILVIGNGFDLAHGLPTSYKDFLEVMEQARKEYQTNSKKSIDREERFDEMTKLSKECFTLDDVINEKNNFLTYRTDTGMRPGISAEEDVYFCYKRKYGIALKPKNFYEAIGDEENIEYNAVITHFFTNNIWYEYFIDKLHNKNMRGEGWIDFESEISEIIRFIEKENVGTWKIRSYTEKEISTIQDLLKTDATKKISNLLGKTGFIKKMKNELDIFIRVLEFYLLMVEYTAEPKQLKFIKTLKITHLLSFNYTNVFNRFYSETIAGKDPTDEIMDNTEYIHGEIYHHNLILGTEETLEKDDENKNLDCIQFKKYFQRIYNRTGLRYKEWLKEPSYVEGCEEKHNVFIIGHSLDITDKEVLKYIITHKNVRETTIYYHDENAHARYIANLVKVIDKDEVIERIGTGNIIFKKQE
jgi:hypothetical protein